jgi:hypothetical protein
MVVGEAFCLYFSGNHLMPFMEPDDQILQRQSSDNMITRGKTEFPLAVSYG